MSALLGHRGATMSYDELYGQAMTFPLVTEADLIDVLLSLHPGVQLHLAGARRKKPVLFKGDYVIIHSRDSL